MMACAWGYPTPYQRKHWKKGSGKPPFTPQLRDTCRDVADPDWDFFKCSECGARITGLSDAWVERSDAHTVGVSYCPVCGRRVVSDADADGAR